MRLSTSFLFLLLILFALFLFLFRDSIFLSHQQQHEKDFVLNQVLKSMEDIKQDMNALRNDMGNQAVRKFLHADSFPQEQTEIKVDGTFGAYQNTIQSLLSLNSRWGDWYKHEEYRFECQDWFISYLMDPTGGKVSGHTFTSQFHQDWILYSAIFRKLQKPGIYLDVGAGTFREISNTYFYDICLGWEGICVEPSESFARGLMWNRNCHLEQKCIWNETNVELSFVGMGHRAGIDGYNKASPSESVVKQTMKCKTVDWVINSALYGTHIDFMSLDIEGAELQALQGVDWEKVKIDVITIENNNKDAIEFLKQKGYVLKLYVHEDVIFIREDLKTYLKWMDDWYLHTDHKNPCISPIKQICPLHGEEA